MSWSCKKCTFINSPSPKPTCQICLSPPSPPPLPSSSSNQETPKWSCKACTFLNPYKNSSCEVCGTRGSVFSLSSLEDLTDTSGLDGDVDSSVGSVFMPLRHCKRKVRDSVDDHQEGGCRGVKSLNNVEVGGDGDSAKSGAFQGVKASNKGVIVLKDGGDGHSVKLGGFQGVKSSNKGVTVLKDESDGASVKLGAFQGARASNKGVAVLTEDTNSAAVLGSFKILSYNVWFRGEREARRRMGEEADPTMKKKKKKGRPSLLELQKRSIKQQQLQQTTPISLKNPNPLNSNSVLPNRRSARRSSNSYAPEWIDGDDDEDDDEDDERKEKKHKLLRGLNSQKNNNQNSNSSSPSNLHGSDSNAGGGNQEDGIRRRKISAVRLGSDDLGEKVLKGTDTIHGSSVEPGPTTPLPDKKLLVFILDRLQKKDTYGVFSEPVDPEELPDYFDIVENPMDFSTVRKKLDEGAYAHLEQFEKDVLLICSNAMQYNPSDTIYFRQARAMQELAKKDFENLRQDSDDSEPQTKVARRGRPPALGKLKKALERSPIDRVGPEASSDATLATGGDHNNLSNGYNLRKSYSYKYQPGDALVRASYSSENYSSWLSEWENEFPASVVKAVMKYGKKPFVLDENKRDTYKHPLGSHEPSILSTFEGELKQLVVVGLSSEHGYARSLARFAADLGPVVWRIASKKIESVLPTGLEFGPGWVGENKAMEKQKILNNLVSDNHLSRFQPAASSSREAAWNREGVLEPVGGLNPQNELATLNSGAGGMKSAPSLQIQQKPIIHPDMNGFSGGFGYNSSPQPGMARSVAPTGKLNLEQTAVPSQMFGVVPTGNSAFISVPGNDFNSKKAMLSETSSGLLQPGISPAVGSSSDSRTFGNVGFGGKSSWQGFLPYQQQGTVPFPPDLNVGFLAPGSPTSSVPIGSPRQPDLALQL